MRVFILGLDGLEYNIVNKHPELENLRQKEYGKLRLLKECLIRTKEGDLTPYTPLVWSTIVTGRLPEETGLMVSQWDNKLLNLLKILTIKTGFDKLKGKGKILELMGFKKIAWNKNNYYVKNVKTIFDLTSKSIQVNVPTVDLNWEIYFGKGLSITQIKNKAILEFINVSKEIKEEIKKDWELFMGYTRLLDVFGHVAWNTQELLRMYQKADTLVKELKELIGDTCLFLIVSDHGMQRLEGTKHGGKHSLHAYYSSNIPLTLERPPAITDIFHIVKSFLSK